MSGKKKNNKRVLSGRPLKKTGDLRETVTDWYLFLMLLVYCLWLPSGFSNTTESKFLFFAPVTLLWFILLIGFSFVEGPPTGFFTPARIAATVFAAVCLLSALCSPFGFGETIIGHRFTGLLTQLMLAMILIGVSRFGHCKEKHFLAFGLSITVFCVICILQKLGLNVFGLYPGDWTFYNGADETYLGTIGNIDTVSAITGLGVPLFLGLAVKREKPYNTIYFSPLFFSALILAAGGAEAGLLGVAVASVVAPAILVRSMKDLRRILAGGALALAGVALGSAMRGSMLDDVLSLRLEFEPPVVVCLFLAAVFAAASGILQFVRREPSGRVFRNVFIVFAVAAVIGAVAAVWSWPGESGSLYEASQILHGHFDDHYGTWRIGIWRTTLTNVPEAPLLGGGPGTLHLRTVYELYYNGRKAYLAHNVYLQYLVDTGGLGLLSYLAVIVTSLFARRRGQWKPVCAALAVAALSYAVQDFFNLGVTIVSPFFWIILGLMQTETHEKPQMPETSG